MTLVDDFMDIPTIASGRVSALSRVAVSATSSSYVVLGSLVVQTGASHLCNYIVFTGSVFSVGVPRVEHPEELVLKNWPMYFLHENFVATSICLYQ